MMIFKYWRKLSNNFYDFLYWFLSNNKFDLTKFFMFPVRAIRSKFEYIFIRYKPKNNSIKIRSQPCLLKKLKKVGFNLNILKNVYIWLGLSRLSKSEPILASIRKSTKTDISSFHHHILRIIGIHVTKFDDIHDIFDENNRKLTTSIPAMHDHPLTRKSELTRSFS